MSMKFKDTIDGSISKNAATATKLATKRTINGTEFDGSANITTTNWGTARNIYIADSSSTNKGTAISVNGSGDVTLKLPATIKASLTGNASTASSAAKLTTGRTISITGVANGSATFDGSSNITIATNPTIFSSSGTSGTQGYIEFARITVTGTYTNRPIEFTLIGRGRPTSCTVSIAFMNTNSSDPGLSSIKYTGSDYGVFIQKTATSTWAVYATKSEAYDTICLVGMNYANQSITITHPGTFITTKPTENVTDATLGGTIKNSVFADKLTTARTITIGNKSNSFDGSANISYTLSEIGAAASGHTHNYAGSSSAGGAATSANKVNTNLAIKLNGGTNEGTNLFTFNGSTAKTINITPSSIGAAASSHGTHVGDAYATATPKANGTAAIGTSSKIAREDHVHPLQTSVSGNAGTATKLQTARTLTIGSTGKTFDGSGNVSWSLSEIGAAAASHGLHFISKVTTTGFDTAYRTQTKGNTNSGEYLATIRNNTANIANAPQYGSGLAWGREDTHGYLYTNYNTPQLYVGGGNADKLNWVKQVSFTDHNHDSKYAAASHGTHVTYATATPSANGTAAVGSSTKVAREDHVHPLQTSVSGNAGTATKLATARTLTIGNKGKNFDGSGNVSWSLSDIGAAETVAWDASIKCATWSRLFQFSSNNVTVGGSFLVNIKATRSSVVYNPTLLVNFSHASRCIITQINNTNYSNIQVRGVVDNNGAGYFEVYDNVNNATNSTTQTVTVSVTKLDRNTTITKYTAFTTGATIPTDYTEQGKITTVSGSHYSGNAASATKLQTTRTINGTNFNGSANITTANWGTARNLQIGDSSKSVNGSANINWTLSEIGALPTAGGTMTGNIKFADVTSTTYPAKSAMLTWNGSTDGADIYYQVDANDKGRLVLNTRDDSDCIIMFANRGESKATIDTSGNFSGKAAKAGNADTATKLAAAKTLTIGGTGKTFDGSANVSWTLAEIGAAAEGHTHSSVASANVLNKNTKMDYNWDGLNYFNVNGTAGNAAKVNDTPTTAWWHILRCNHANASGYYTDIAVPFNATSMYYKRITNGAVQNNGWVKMLDALNFNEYAAAKNHGTHVDYATATPKVAGTAAVGTSNKVAREDHVHPLQTSVSGNAGTATKLETKRTINGTNFDGSANITTANWGTSRKINQISVNGSADVKLPLDYYTCNVGSSNAKPYHHILATGQCTDSYTDKSITIVLVNHYNGAGFGIAKATLRTNDAANGGTATGELRWIVRSGFAENSLCFNIRNTAKDAYMDVFYKSGGTYASLTWYVLTEGARGNHSSVWTKYNTHHDNGTNVYNETDMKAIRTYTATLQSAVDHGAVNSAKTAAACSGNAATATTLQTARNIALGGVLSGSASFNGSANVTINASVAKPPKSGDWFSGGMPIVSTDGVMEVGKYIDFHNTDTSTNDYDVRLQANTSTPCVITLPSGNGTLARTSDSITGNAATATKLSTARTIQIGNKSNSFDGSANISYTLADIGAAAASHSHNENTLTRTLVTKTASSNTLTLGTERYQLASGLSNGGTINLPASPALLTEINLIINNVSLTTLNLPDTCKWRVDHNLEVGKYFMITFLYVATNVWLTEIKVYS